MGEPEKLLNGFNYKINFENHDELFTQTEIFGGKHDPDYALWVISFKPVPSRSWLHTKIH